MQEHAHNRTLPMSVANTGFMLDRLGQDCAPLQFLRELTKNGIEAVEALVDPDGSVVWDVEWSGHEITGILKLSISDNGIGMTGPEMIEYINKLSSSGHMQSHEGNFGVGAKIAAATRNHAGLVYLSWKDGHGAMIHLWRDPTTGVYGLKQFEWPDGSFQHWLPIGDEAKPETIQDHGTVVVLMGHEDEANTMAAPDGVSSPSRWVTYYLNTRFFKFPDSLSVKAREGWEHPRSNTDSNVLRTLTGQGDYLARHSQSSGTVQLTGGQARWWVLRAETALSSNSGILASSGHMAALFQDELYEMATGRGGTARLQNFGVIFGHNRVVIYLEPEAPSGQTLAANTARTQLLIDGNVLPWSDWAAEFRSSMPQEIQDLMEEVTAGTEQPNHRTAILDRLRQIRDLFRLTRYRPSATGQHLVDPDALTVGSSATSSDDPSSGGRKRRGRQGGGPGNVYALFASNEGVPAEPTTGDGDPQVTWVTAAEGTRIPPDLEDRAARYLHEQNRLIVNGDFRVFTDFEDRWAGRYEDVPGSRSAIRETVREWFEQTLMETVLGTRSLRGSREWDVEDLKKSLSEEALTAAVMPRYHVEMAVRRALGARLGSLRERATGS